MSADREMDHLEMMSGMIDRHHNQPCCYAEAEDPENESIERMSQLVASAAASFYHTNLVNLIQERVGDGEPLDMLLRDTYYREKFRMAARKL
jgi:hypothetical protein